MTDPKLNILVPESRELDLFAEMLEAEGAVTVRCPLVEILDLEDRAAADRWIAAFIARPCDDLILLTGEGLRKLIALSGPGADALAAALGRCRTITRGPKPARALRELGLKPGCAAKVPTSAGVLDALAGADLQGRRIGVQLYPGDGGLALVTALRERGAEVLPVTPYRYAPQADAERVASAIKALAAGEIGWIAFTSTPQVERLFAVARETGLEQELKQGLARARVASIGPVVTQTLETHGVLPAVQPRDSFHLKPLVREIVAAWKT
ncbi:MAG: uroporphyrinogen-III synthase [Rhodospirillaceae bacterium]